jgi:hypothetical protein
LTSSRALTTSCVMAGLPAWERFGASKGRQTWQRGACRGDVAAATQENGGESAGWRAALARWCGCGCGLIRGIAGKLQRVTLPARPLEGRDQQKRKKPPLVCHVLVTGC